VEMNYRIKKNLLHFYPSLELRLLSFQKAGFLVPKKMGALNVQSVLITQTEMNATGILRDNISEEDHYSCLGIIIMKNFLIIILVTGKLY